MIIKSSDKAFGSVKPLTAKIQGELHHTLEDLNDGVSRVVTRVGGDDTSINKSTIVKELMILGLKSNEPLLRIGDRSWTAKEILIEEFPILKNKITTLDDLINREKLFKHLITAEANAVLELLKKERKMMNKEDYDFFANRTIEDLEMTLLEECDPKDVKLIFKWESFRRYINDGTNKKILLTELQDMKYLNVLNIISIFDNYLFSFLIEQLEELISIWETFLLAKDEEEEDKAYKMFQRCKIFLD